MRTELRSDEQVIFQTGKHWIVMIQPLLLIAAALLLFLFSPTKGLPLQPFVDGVTYLGLFGALLYLVYIVFERRFNIWVVTNRRIIDEWGIISANAKESLLDKINNVLCRQSLLGRILDYGSVEIQTAAEQGATVLTQVAAPLKLRDAIIETSERYRWELMHGAPQHHEDGDRCTQAPAATLRHAGGGR